MTKYILKRLLWIIPIMVGVSFIVYFIMSLTPNFSNPALVKLGLDATPEQLAEMNKKLGADKPFFPRYFSYMAGVVRGDFGVSYSTTLNV